MRKLIQNSQVVVGLSPTPAALSSTTVDSISLANYQHVSILIAISKGAGTETGAVALTQDTSVTPTGSVKALAFTKMWKVADIATTDVPVETAVVSSTFNLGGVASKNSLFVIEVDTDDLDVENDFDCLTVTLGDTATAFASVVYVLSQPRNIQETHVTAIA